MPLNKSAKPREGSFSGIPTLRRHFVGEIAFSPRTLVAAGGQDGDPGAEQRAQSSTFWSAG